MRWLPLLVLLPCACVRGPVMTNNSGNSSAQSGNSSAQSGNSSAQSGNSSGQSANSSNTSATSKDSANSSGTSANSSNSSAASSQGSNQSSAGSNASTGSSNGSSGSSNQSSNGSRNSSASVQSSANSTQATTDVPSSQVVAGSALLLAVAGGIVATVYTVQQRQAARLQAEQLRRLQQPPAPQPLPYPVQPLPPDPGVAPPTQPQPPAPGFQPAPFPGSRGALDAPPSLDAMVQARAWLEANQLQLKQDLALGAGPTLEDLAGIAGIAPAHRAHFGRVLQRHRAALLVPRELTPQQAAEVMAGVGALVLADPLLRADAQALLASW